MNSGIAQPHNENERLQNCSGQNTKPDTTHEVYADNNLVQRSRIGDLAAFEELFRRHQKRIYSIAMYLLQDENEAADATQDVFVKAYESLDRLKADAAFVTWLKAITVNLCRDFLRRRRRLRIDSLDSTIEHEDGSHAQADLPDESGNPAVLLDQKTMQEIVRKAVGSLSQDYREVVTLFYVDGKDVAEIAKMLNCPVGTVKARLSRARAELKRKLECYVKQ